MTKTLRIMLIVLLVLGSGLYVYSSFNKLSPDGITYIKVDGEKYGPYDSTPNPDVIFNSKGDYYTRSGTDNYSLVTLSGGKKIGPYKHLEVQDFDKNSASYEYSKDGKGFWHYEGKTWGPYEGMSWVRLQDGKYIYSYIEGGKSYINKNGEIKGPYEDVKYITMDSEGNMGHTIKENGKWNVTYFGKTYGPISADSVKFDSLGGNEFCVIAKEGDKTYLYYNDDKKGPYKEIKSSYFVNGKLQITYVDINDGKTYMLYDGKKIDRGSDCKHYRKAEICNNGEGIYILSVGKKIKVDAIKPTDVSIYDDDKLYYGYKSKNDGSYYLNLGGKEKGPFVSKVIRVNVDEDNNNISYYYEKEDGFYIVRGDKTVGPLDEIMSSGFGLGNYAYKKDGKDYAFINGKEFGPYESIESDIIRMAKNKTEYFVYKKGGKYFYNINGETEVGPFDNFGRVFKYGSDYKVYSYTNNGKDYLSINGKIKGPFRKLLDFSVAENGRVNYKYIDKYYTRGMEKTIDIYENLK